jgi:hypothetical protein
MPSRHPKRRRRSHYAIDRAIVEHVDHVDHFRLPPPTPTTERGLTIEIDLPTVRVLVVSEAPVLVRVSTVSVEVRSPA